MNTKKYSITALPETATLLLKLQVQFVCARGNQFGKMRLFFIADEDACKSIEDNTKFSIADEELGWDFNGWDALL